MGKDRRYREARSERSCRRRSAPQSATCLIPPVRGDLRHRLALILVTGMVGVYLYAAEPSPATTALGADNPIVVENQFPGSNAWLPGSSIADDAAGQIKGYASATSVAQGQSISLFVTVSPAQTYNNYPNNHVTGKSLYSFNSYGPNTVAGETRAVKVSFDRPYADYGFPEVDAIEFIRWIERSGYDVTYSTNIDTHANGSALLTHKAFMSIGHDEYWSKPMFDAVQAARDAGVGLAFFGADAVSVQVRIESATDGEPNRVVVCYKSAALDPEQGQTPAGACRGAAVNRTEQALRRLQDTFHAVENSNVDYVDNNTSHWI